MKILLKMLPLCLALLLATSGVALAEGWFYDTDGDGHHDQWMSYDGYVYEIYIDSDGYRRFATCDSNDYIDKMETNSPTTKTAGPPDLSTIDDPSLPPSCFDNSGSNASGGGAAGPLALLLLGGAGIFVFARYRRYQREVLNREDNQ